MQDRPTLRELLDAAEDFLRTDLRPQLSGAAQFHTLVTANVLSIIKRELDGYETFNAEEAERLRTAARARCRRRTARAQLRALPPHPRRRDRDRRRAT